ncbi:MAG: 2-oxoglutarate dehydrogenase complex dihydrolipoyllysine-residue succinyltransferase [Deltaproteobacteria bacterium]|nr:2-oxoglutarate dehydrogenase complex dihydrolipoyllysine-residue succinyltransferase [Deltaproteobacteria bacterium]MCK5710559.1 2-oxoglutarate dehydrogenase complex dihydrolipoyllysine-residue succinyltransferase [Deltaproteobacteria bacterium]
MSTNIVVPELGESIVEATVIRWFKSEGDSVKIGEALLELETEKANFEVAAEKPGIIKTILKRDNDDVEVGEVLGVLEEADASSAVQAEVVKEEDQEKEEPSQPKEEVLEKITPVARRLAEEFDVDLSKVEATGTSGRITKEDVERYIQMEVEESEIEASSVEPIHKAPAVIPPTLAVPRDVREERIKMSRRRRTIARRMLEATQTTAMLTTFNEVDMSAVMELRKRRKESFIERYGVNLGLNSFFVKASIGALKEFPPVNGEIDGDDMILKYYYDIGVAIGASEGLVVPVLKNADSMSFAEIEKRIKEFAVKAEENTLALEDIMGGTFTITNGGVFGSLMSTPILNPPQVGILGLHKIEQRPIVINGELEIRPMMYVALSYDHRIVDGREAVQFLVRLKELIQDPESLLLEG